MAPLLIPKSGWCTADEYYTTSTYAITLTILLMQYICNLGKKARFGWAIIWDFAMSCRISSFGGFEGGNKTLRVYSFCSKNYIEQQELVLHTFAKMQD